MPGFQSPPAARHGTPESFGKERRMPDTPKESSKKWFSSFPVFVLFFGCVMIWRGWLNRSHQVDGVSSSRGGVVMNWQLLAAGTVAILGAIFSLVSAYRKKRSPNQPLQGTPAKAPSSSTEPDGRRS